MLSPAHNVGIHSGETFFRSNPDVNKEGGMLEGIGDQLMDFLQSGGHLLVLCYTLAEDLLVVQAKTYPRLTQNAK